MKFGLFDRREQKMKKLGALVAATEDRALMAALEQGGVEDLALLLRIVPMSRMNPLLGVVPLERVREAFGKLRGAAKSYEGVTDQAIGSLVTLLTTQFAEREGPIMEEISISGDDENDLNRPVCIRALDFAGKILAGDD
jgi:hypothetical protein